jgi:hypothetical protein
VITFMPETWISKKSMDLQTALTAEAHPAEAL